MWTDFFICLFLGWLGVHKFREHKAGMGILYLFTFGLFGIGWIIDCVKYLIRALGGGTPESASQPLSLSPDGTLPIVMDASVVLQPGETCHFSSSANRIIPKNKVVGYTGGNVGASFRVAKGVTLRTGTNRGQQVRQNVLESHPGRLIITNKRILFSSTDGGFDKKIENLSLVSPAEDGISLQFGSQNYLIEVKDSNRAYQIIQHIVQNG